MWEVGGEQREKMGIQLKGKKGAMPPEEERRGDGKARGMSMAGRGGPGQRSEGLVVAGRTECGPRGCS